MPITPPPGYCLLSVVPKLFATATLIAANYGFAANQPPDGTEELIRQQQRDRALQQQQQTSPDVRREGRKARETSGRLPMLESPCFTIERLTLKGDSADRFQWALKFADGDNDTPVGRCLGAEGINVLLKRVQNTMYTIRIPKGTVIYEGPVGYQGGIYLGGPSTNQVFVQTPWSVKGVQVLNSTPIR